MALSSANELRELGDYVATMGQFLTDYAAIILIVLGLVGAALTAFRQHSSGFQSFFPKAANVVGSLLGFVSSLALLSFVAARSLWGWGKGALPTPPQCLADFAGSAASATSTSALGIASPLASSAGSADCVLEAAKHAELVGRVALPVSTLLVVAILFGFLVASFWLLVALKDAWRK